jgi:hypothetical protein
MNSTDPDIAWAKREIAAEEIAIIEREKAIATSKARIADLRGHIRILEAKAPKNGTGTIMGAVAPPDPLSQRVIVSAELAAMVDASVKGAKKRAILALLDSYNTHMQTAAIVSLLPAMGVSGATVENTSPQLSAYKNDGLVLLENDGWKITKSGRAYLAEKN